MPVLFPLGVNPPVASVPKGGKGWGRVWVCTLPEIFTGTLGSSTFPSWRSPPPRKPVSLVSSLNVYWKRLVPVLFPLGVTPTEATSGLGAQGR